LDIKFTLRTNATGDEARDTGDEMKNELKEQIKAIGRDN